MSKMSTESARIALNGPTMGTRWSALFFAEPSLDPSPIRVALQAAVDEVDGQMSTWKPDSDLMRLNAAPVGLALLDRDLRYVRVNPMLAEINGASVEAHLGRRVREVLPHIADAVEPLYRSVLETGAPVLGVEVTGTTAADDEVHHWLSSYVPVREDRGDVSAVIGMAIDINSRENGRGTVGQMNRQVVEIFKKWGFAWGGDWSWTDPMHFELARIVSVR